MEEKQGVQFHPDIRENNKWKLASMGDRKVPVSGCVLVWARWSLRSFRRNSSFVRLTHCYIQCHILQGAFVENRPPSYFEVELFVVIILMIHMKKALVS